MKHRRFSWFVWSLLASSPAAAQDMIDPGSITTFAQLVRPAGVAWSIALLASVWIFLRLMNGFFDALSRAFNNRRMLIKKIRVILSFAVYIGVGTTVVLLSFDLSAQAIAILSGGLAVGLGFATKDLVASLISGLVILFEQPFQVGDRVKFGGFYGDVNHIGLRSVRLQTLDDNTVTIPNNLFLQEIISSGNFGALEMQVVVDFLIGIDQDAGRARELVHAVGVTSPFSFLGKPVVVLVSQEMVETYFAICLRLKVYVHDVTREKDLVSDVTVRVLEAFKKAGIEPPARLIQGGTG